MSEARSERMTGFAWLARAVAKSGTSAPPLSANAHQPINSKCNYHSCVTLIYYNM